MRSPPLALPLLLLLGACGTPQERCIARETRDLRSVDRQIAEAEGNLARGHALVEVRVTEDYWSWCPVVAEPPPEGKARLRPCLKERVVTETRARPIDPAAERARLAGLQAQRKGLAAAAEGAVARCRAAFPEDGTP